MTKENVNYKPKEYNSVSPYLVVENAQKLIDLLINIFDATVTRQYDNPDGSIMQVEIKIDDSIIMISDATENYKAFKSLLHVYVPDSKLTYNKAITLGCEGIEEPVHKENDPDLRGQFKDYNGNTWAIGTQIKD